MSDTDLHNAVERGDFDKVQHLIWQKKVDVNKKDWFGTALHVASRSRNRPQLNIVRELLKAPNIKVNEVNVYGDRAIHDAVFFNRIHALRELLRHPSINVTDPCKEAGPLGVREADQDAPGEDGNKNTTPKENSHLFNAYPRTGEALSKWSFTG